MRKAIGLAVALLWASTANSQTPPDTFSAGVGDPVARFYVSDASESAKVAIRLPESMAGTMILGITAFYQQPPDAPVAPEVWAEKAGFVWGLSTGTVEQPGSPTSDMVEVPLKNYPNLQFGGWFESETEWPVLQGVTYWLVGYWPKNSKLTRLTSNHRNDATDICVGQLESAQNAWYPWNGGGLMVEVAYGEPQEGTPSGIFDPSSGGEPVAGRPLSAAISQDGLTISLDVASESYQGQLPYDIHVVNILGQTIVTQRGHADFNEIRIPWSANRPSGVYFCRIQLGSTSYTVPVVNLK